MLLIMVLCKTMLSKTADDGNDDDDGDDDDEGFYAARQNE